MSRDNPTAAENAQPKTIVGDHDIKLIEIDGSLWYALAADIPAGVALTVHDDKVAGSVMLPVKSHALDGILRQLKIMNMHLSELTGENFVYTDVEE